MDRPYKHLTNKELLKLYKEYDEMIHGENSCYGVNDLFILAEIERECNLREE